MEHALGHPLLSQQGRDVFWAVVMQFSHSWWCFMVRCRRKLFLFLHDKHGISALWIPIWADPSGFSVLGSSLGCEEHWGLSYLCATGKDSQLNLIMRENSDNLGFSVNIHLIAVQWEIMEKKVEKIICLLHINTPINLMEMLCSLRLKTVWSSLIHQAEGKPAAEISVYKLTWRSHHGRLGSNLRLLNYFSTTMFCSW